jgi:hypothetical protein
MRGGYDDARRDIGNAMGSVGSLAGGIADGYGAVRGDLAAGRAGIGALAGDMRGGFDDTRGDIAAGRGQMGSMFDSSIGGMLGPDGSLQGAYDQYLSGRDGTLANMRSAFDTFQDSNRGLVDNLNSGFRDSSGTINRSLDSINNNYTSTVGQLRDVTAGNRSAFDTANSNIGGLASGINAAGGAATGAINAMNANVAAAMEMNSKKYDGLMQFLTRPNGEYSQFQNDMYGLTGRMGDSFDGTNNNIGGVIGNLTGAYGGAQRGVQDLWNNSMGKTEWFQTDAEKARIARETALLNRRYGLEDQLFDRMNPGLQKYPAFRTPDDIRRGLETLPRTGALAGRDPAIQSLLPRLG